jgi:hypothetical protein
MNIYGYSPYVTFSLTKVCLLQLLLALASAVILGSESRETHDYILMSPTRGSPTLEGHIPVFIAPRNMMAQLYLQAMGSLSSPPTTRRATVEVFDPASTRDIPISIRAYAQSVLLPDSPSFCRTFLITTLHGLHGKQGFLLSRMHVYWSVN